MSPDSFAGDPPLYGAAGALVISTNNGLTAWLHELQLVCDFTVARLGAVLVCANLTIENAGANAGDVDVILLVGSHAQVTALPTPGTTVAHSGPQTIQPGAQEVISVVKPINPPASGQLSAAVWTFKETANGTLAVLGAQAEAVSGVTYHASSLDVFFPST